MNPLLIIAKHLSKEYLKLEIFDIETKCAFTGENINKAVKVKDLVSDVFTDYQYIRYGDYASVDAALCLAEVVKTSNGFNSLRNYSYLATEKELIFLKRENILDILLNLQEKNFVIAISYSFKKHLSYKCVLNENSDSFYVTTDLGTFLFDRKIIAIILPIMQSQYKSFGKDITYFTKQEIMYGNPTAYKIDFYGIEKYMQENEILENYRNTLLFNFIIHILNKC